MGSSDKACAPLPPTIQHSNPTSNKKLVFRTKLTYPSSPARREQACETLPPVCLLCQCHHAEPRNAARLPPTTLPTMAATQGPINYSAYDPSREVAQLEAIRSMISTDLSEPYSIYVYRYFLYQWGDLCYMAFDGDLLVGVVVGKLERHRGGPLRGYIAMLATKKEYRGNGIGMWRYAWTGEAVADS